MKLDQCAPVADGYVRRAGAFPGQGGVDLPFRPLIQGRRGFVQKEPARGVDQGPRESQALLFPDGKDMGPVPLFVMGSSDAPQP